MDAGEKGQVERIIRAAVEGAGFELFRLTIRPNRSVALVLDKDDRSITLNDCVLVNRKVRRALEDAGVEVDDYSIDVESPGTDRPLLTLRHYERFMGERIKLVLHEPLAGNSNFVGSIAAVDGERISIKPDNADQVQIPFRDIKSARLQPQLPF